MPSDAIRDTICAARVALCESGAARLIGGMTVQESVSMVKLERAISAFLDEVGA